MRISSHFLTLTAVVLAALPAAASEPGQPLDCSDWVFLEPGLSCRVFTTQCDNPDSPQPDEQFCDWPDAAGSDPGYVLDNNGGLYRIHEMNLPNVQPCFGLRRYELRRHDGSGETTVAYVEQRCMTFKNGGPTIDQISLRKNLKFDEQGGRFLISSRTDCNGGTLCSYGYSVSIIAIEGFTTTFEILQFYEPATNAWSFRVPYMPEGLPGADYFDTYYGDLATVGDWGKAQPLQCGFPNTSPSVGDYITVADSLPNPAPNTGRYYVTAVNHQGQRRYGRQFMNGVLSGRDPAVLPVCQ